MVARPQTPQEKEAPWPLVVTRQGLLTATWGSKKGADLLWHFLNKARWEIKNQNLSTSVKVIIFQESRSDIFKAIESAKLGNSISQGTYNTLLRAFVEVGYIVNQPYSDTFEVHLDAIEKAFTNPPQKAGRATRKPKAVDESCVNSTHYNTDTISREEFNSLVEVCVNVSKMCQCLSIQVAELTQMCQRLTHYNIPQEASDAGSNATIEAQSNALEIMLNANDSPPKSPTGEKPETEDPSSQDEDQLSEKAEEEPGEHGAAGGYTQSGNGSGEQSPRRIFPDLRQGLREFGMEARQETPAQIKKRMERRKSDIFALYARLTNVPKVVKSKENQDGADMLADIDATDEHITIAVEEIQADPFWSKQMNLRTVATQLQNRVSDRQKRESAQKRGNGHVTVPNDDGMVMWMGRMMTYAEADENGWNGGFGEFIQHTHYGRTVIA